ncbi:MAG: electron transfer flavoprotein subunit beta/FixA family protein [SAR324 cluster bacterium]|nr:electron transfer flavoprotein subunit beta/FixA family protein [SAR324 cluster bacterium]
MEIIVPIKQVPDVALNIKVKDGEIVQEGISWVISSWDETALEAALQLTEEVGGEVTVLSIGPDKTQEALRKALAMGAHKALHVQCDSTAGWDSYQVAKVLAKTLEGRDYHLVITGKQAQDSDAGLTPTMLAEFLGLPQVTNITAFKDASDSSITLHRKGDDGIEISKMTLPGVVTVNDSLAEPRLASMRGIMMAKKKPMEIVDLNALGLAPEVVHAGGLMTEVVQHDKPDERKEGRRFEGDETDTVPEVMQNLKENIGLFA